MIDNYEIFVERKVINEGNFLGYKTPFDENNPIIVIEKNGDHLYFESNLIKEYNNDFEFKTDNGVWRLKSDKLKSINIEDINSIDIKVDIDYRYLGLTFTPKYNINKDIYYTTIQPINNYINGNQTYPSWVIYANNLNGLKDKIVVKIELYKKHYNI